MNGKEQRERKTAIIALQEDLKKGLERVETAALDAFKVELESRLKQAEELKELFARMVDDETTFRKADILRAKVEVMGKLMETNNAVVCFISLSWWRRWMWCIFGPKALLWFPVPGITAPTPPVAPVQAGKGSYTSEKP